MKNVSKFLLLAFLFAFLVQPILGDNIPMKGEWREEDYRSIDASQPPFVSVEAGLLTLNFEDALSDLTVCVLNSNGVKVYEDVVTSEAGGNYSISLAGEVKGQYQVVLLHKLGHLTGDFTLE